MNPTQLTIITRSKESFNRTVPDGVFYLNHVSTITDVNSECIQNTFAISKVTTPYFMFVDTDDEIPEYIPLPSKGLVYGDLLTKNSKELIRAKYKEFCDGSFMKNVYMLHKPCYNTKNIQWIIENLPSIEGMHFNLYYHYFLAMLFGATYDPKFDAIWNKGQTGLHKKAYPLKSQFDKWMKANRFSIWLKLQNQLNMERKR